jgi:uncharacterized membrane protein SpoIIM required for sporulation
MRERKFVNQNIDKWAQIERNLKRKQKNPEELRRELIQVTDDLAYARTFYRSRSIRVYLNGLAQSVYQSLYARRKPVWKSVKSFFQYDVPKIIYFSRMELLVSFLLLILSVGIGILSTSKDASFANAVLGSDYVKMTEENIKSGNPLGVYKNQDQLSMFYSIARNNLEVGLKVFLFGLLASYGAVILMLGNGIALGVFIYFFYSRNLAAEFNTTVWMHGSIEILTLVIETLAGILLGKGLVYPGTMSRSKAFAVWGRRAAMLYLATIPFVLFAAFIESFLTRYTEMPNLLRLMLIFSSVALMVFYFIWYPIKTFRNKIDPDIEEAEMKADSGFEFSTKNILSTAQVFNKSLQFIGLHFKLIIGFCFGVTFLFLALDFVVQNNEYFKQYQVFTLDIETMLAQFIALNFTELYLVFGNIGVLLNTNNSLVLYALNSILMGSLLLFSFHIFHSYFKQLKRNKLASVVYAFVLSFGFNLAFLQNYFILQILTVFISPILFGFYVDQALKIKKISVIEKLKLLLGNQNKRIRGLALILFVQLTLGTFFIVSPFSSLSISFVQLNFDFSDELNEFISEYLMAFLMVFMLSISLVMFFLQSMFLNFTLNEILSANEITEGIENIGKNKKVYGIETE